MEKVSFDKNSLLPYVKELGENKRNSAVKKIKYIGGGSFGRVYEILYTDGGVEILKAFKFVEMLNSEAEALKLLRQVSPLKLPEVYYTHIATDKYPIDVLAMEKIEGITTLNLLFLLFCGKKKRAALADIITDALGKIHEVTSDKFGFIQGTGTEDRFDTWQEFYGLFARDIYEKAKAAHAGNRLNNHFFMLLKKGMENFDYILADPVDKPTLLHGDLHLANIMIDKKTSMPTGIIDPLNSMWGDKEYDLFQLNAIFGKRFGLYDAYKRKFKTSERVDLKCAFYALVNEVMCHMRTDKYSKYLYNTIRKRMEDQFKIHNL